MSTDSTKYNDLFARAGWTALQAAVGALVVYVSSIDVSDDPGLAAAVVTVVATVLSSLKSLVASKVGDSETVTFR